MILNMPICSTTNRSSKKGLKPNHIRSRTGCYKEVGVWGNENSSLQELTMTNDRNSSQSCVDHQGRYAEERPKELKPARMTW